MYCGLVGIEGTFRMVVGRKVSIDESLAQAVTKHSVGNLQQATGIMNAGRDVCWEDVAGKTWQRRSFQGLSMKLALQGRETFG